MGTNSSGLKCSIHHGGPLPSSPHHPLLSAHAEQQLPHYYQHQDHHGAGPHPRRPRRCCSTPQHSRPPRLIPPHPCRRADTVYGGRAWNSGFRVETSRMAAWRHGSRAAALHPPRRCGQSRPRCCSRSPAPGAVPAAIAGSRRRSWATNALAIALDHASANKLTRSLFDVPVAGFGGVLRRAADVGESRLDLIEPTIN